MEKKDKTLNKKYLLEELINQINSIYDIEKRSNKFLYEKNKEINIEYY